MKANHHSFIFIILAILLSFFTPLSELCLNVFSDKMYTESSMQDSCIGLQYASIIENNNEFENHTPEYDLSTCFCLTSRKLHEVEIYFLCKKYVFVKQILFSGKASRSPPCI
jgi:nonstructural protein NSm